MDFLRTLWSIRPGLLYERARRVVVMAVLFEVMGLFFLPIIGMALHAGQERPANSRPRYCQELVNARDDLNLAHWCERTLFDYKNRWRTGLGYTDKKGRCREVTIFDRDY